MHSSKSTREQDEFGRARVHQQDHKADRGEDNKAFKQVAAMPSYPLFELFALAPVT